MDTPTTRFKMKVGEHEFDAEGSADSVREIFQAWQELVKLAVTSPAPVQPPPQFTAPIDARDLVAQPQKADEPNSIDSALPRIMRLENRTVSLTARPSSVHDAILVMLYGQKTLRNNDAVTGAELLSGLASTGGFAVSRLDRILDKLAEDGDVLAFGERRGKRYRLTNTGIGKARSLAAERIKAVA